MPSGPFWVSLGSRGATLPRAQVPKSVPDLQLSAYGFFMMVPTGADPAGASGSAAMTDGPTPFSLLGATLVGVFAYFAITIATRIGDVSVITPFRYSRLVFALILGITFFGERPDLLTFAGAALIIGSGLYTFLRERHLARRAQRVHAR